MKNKIIQHIASTAIIGLCLSILLCACDGSGSNHTTAGGNGSTISSVSSNSAKKMQATNGSTSSQGQFNNLTFVYMVDHRANVIYTFRLNYDKTLTQLSNVSIGGSGAYSVTISPDKKHLYVVLDIDKKIKHFVMNQDNYGTLTLQADELMLDYKPGKLIFAGNSKAYISSSPDETNPHLMVVDYDSSSGKFGSLVSYVADQKSASGIVLSADKLHFWEGFTNVDFTGNYSIKGFYSSDSLYQTTSVSSNNSSDQNIGDVSALVVQDIESYENVLAIDKTNQRLLSYRFDLSGSTTGIVSEMNGVTVESGFNSMVVTSNGKFTYIANAVSNTIQRYALNESGAMGIIFVTNGTYSGNLSGYTGADDICNKEAQKVEAGTTVNSLYNSGIRFKALLGGNNATEIGTTYYRPDQTTIITTANSGNLFDNGGDPTAKSLTNSISALPEGDSYLWTGITRWSGATDTSHSCNGWTSSVGDGSVLGTPGDGAHRGSGDGDWWTNDANAAPCNLNGVFHLACVGQSYSISSDKVVSPGLLKMNSDDDLLFVARGNSVNAVESLALAVYEINPIDGSIKYLTSITGASSTITDMLVVEYQRPDDLVLYTTTQTYWGNLNGISGADEKCQLDSQCPESAICKAILGSDARYPGSSDWVLASDQRYKHANGEIIGITTAGGIFDATDTESLNGYGGGSWTGLRSGWTKSTETCEDWTVGSSTDMGATPKRGAIEFSDDGDMYGNCSKYTHYGSGGGLCNHDENNTVGCSERHIQCAQQ